MNLTTSADTGATQLPINQRTIAEISLPSVPSMIPESRGTNLGLNLVPDAISLYIHPTMPQSTLAVGIPS
jgi:hypothetical protein